MHELRSEEFERCRPIFHGITHDRAPVFAVLEGSNPGRAFVDDPAAPTSCLLWTSGGEIYLGGVVGDDGFCRESVRLVLEELVPAATHEHLLMFGLSEGWKSALDGLFRDRGVTRIIRHSFALNRGRFRAHAGWRERVPAGYAVCPMDRELAAHDPGIEVLWGSVERFLARAFGFCVVRGSEFVSRCSPAFLGDRHFETGIFTEEPYRRRGLAMLAATAFIERCLDEGYLPDWDCYWVNQASRALALKLGFDPLPDVEVHWVRLRS